MISPQYPSYYRSNPFFGKEIRQQRTGLKLLLLERIVDGLD